MVLLEATLKSYRERVERALDRWLPAAEEKPTRLHEAMRYSLEAGGKRIRPVLVLLTAEAGQADGAIDPEPAAVALELIHTYSLIHDDLPCMDDSDLRRGRPSCHTQFDEETALLAGDGLLTEAFTVLARGYASQPEIATGLVEELADAAGSRKLIGGQMADLEAEADPPNITDEDVRFIYANKTGALFAAALAMGGRLAYKDEAGLARLRETGLALGLAFQVQDDLLDASGTADALGKPVGQDAAKPTFVALHGVAYAQDTVREATSRCLQLWKEAGMESAAFESLVAQLAERTN